MKRFPMRLVLALTILFIVIMSFSIVQGDAPTMVQNQATMTNPYETGYRDSGDNNHGHDAEGTSDFDVVNGIIYARAFASKTSDSWAYSYIQDAFQIIHSSEYRVAFRFNYSGTAKIIGVNQASGEANIKVNLTAYLVDRNLEQEVIEKTETVANYDSTEDAEIRLVGTKDIYLTANLEENHIYDWRAELRTEASALVDDSSVVESTANFFDEGLGYQAEITQVLVQDLNPDNAPPTTIASLEGTLGEGGWYNSSVAVLLNATDDGYGIDYINQRINSGSWTQYALPIQINFEGTNTVEFYSIDKAGNEENVTSVSMKIDNTPPTGRLTINNDDQYTNSEEVTLSIEAQDGQGSGLSQMRLRNEEEAWSSWITYATSVPWNLPTGDGSKTVYVQFKDKAGNISPETQTNDTITLDTKPPIATISINNNEEYTNSTAVTLYLEYSDNSAIDQVRYSNNEGTWDTNLETPTQTRQWILLPGDGNKTVYAQFRDKAHLNSEVISDTIVLDTTVPNGSIEINNGALSTTSTSVTITSTVTDANGVAQMRLRNEGGNWSDWEEVTAKTWILPSGLGSKTVFAQFKDYAGLVSSDSSATIQLVEPEPSASPTPTPKPSSTPSETGNLIVYVKDANNQFVSGATVTSNAQPANQQALKGTTDSQGIVTFNNIAVGPYSFCASKGTLGSNEVEVNIRNQQTSSINVTLQEDTVEPTVSVTLNEKLGSLQQVFTVTGEDDNEGSGIARIALYVDDVPVAVWTTAGTHNYNEGVYSIGTHAYYVDAIDNAGNTVRNPTSGYFEFTVIEGAYVAGQTELWKLLGVIVVLATGTALLFFSLKRKK